MMMPEVRPIDANALDIIDLPCYYGGNCDLDKIEEWVFNAPTLDYAPVRHGEWKLFGEKPITIRVDEWVVCSECNRDFMRITGIWFNYCPYCGAKMDGGQHDH